MPSNGWFKLLALGRFEGESRFGAYRHDLEDHLHQPGAGPDLWATVVAQRLGFAEDEALTLGKAVAGLNARAKGRRLGLFKPHEEKAKKAQEKEPGERLLIGVCGQPVPATNTSDGIRAVRGC
jgi:hypothetical protein